MITFLKGTLTAALPTQAVVDLNGFGCEVLIPLSLANIVLTGVLKVVF